jgi:GPH family glycoside/pentoside/hexuronide:cation symporter
MVFAGVGIGFGYAPPYSMLPDAIEVEALRAGRRHEGSYYGMWTFTSKVGTALAGMATGLILGYSGYVADAVQGPAALFAMRLILGPIPAAILVAGVLLIQRYPIDEAFYAKAMAGKEPQA